MFRTRAVKQLLLEDVAGLRLPDRGERKEALGAGPDDDRGMLERARRRAILVVILDWVALVVLIVARSRSGGVFEIGPTEESIFSIGLLAIAAHSGFRLGQLEKLQAVSRALTELADRSRPDAAPRESP